MTVVKFPDKGRAGVLKRKLSKKAEALEKLYLSLEEYYGGVDEAEIRLAKAEAAYDQLLVEYAEAVGLENVELEYLSYSTKMKAKRNDQGEVEFYLEDET